MKISVVIFTSLIAIALLISSCTKPAIIPGGNNGNNNNSTPSSCTITFNGNDTHTADSTHWDYYSGFTRVQSFIGGTAIFTLYLNGMSTNTYTLAYQNLYWKTTTANTYTVNSYGGAVYLTNTNDVLSGSMNATGSLYSGTGASQTTIAVSFSNVKQLGS